jgi:formate dehydrogenase iron-sulfur subunit
MPRRAFLRAAGVAALGGAGGGAAASRTARAAGFVPASDPETLARGHADDHAVLIDITRCVGCARCVAACKAAAGLPWREDQPATGPEARLASSNPSVVRAVRAQVVTESLLGPRTQRCRRYVKVQCMHCLEPACASACFMGALRKREDGAVVYDPDRCVGCRYCMVACPFGVPTFDWDAPLGRIEKCDLCAERTARGRPTACAEACAFGGITFGRRHELLAEAWRRIEADPRYVRHVYGEHEVGGTSVLYISDVPFDALGFPASLPEGPLPHYTWQVTRLVPPVAAGVLATLTVLYARRRRYLEEHATEASSGARVP